MRQPRRGSRARKSSPSAAERREGRGPSNPRRSAPGQRAPARSASLPRAIAARELKRILPGSLAAHQSLERAVLDRLALERVPAVPIYTGPRLGRGPAGAFELRGNPGQRGFADVLAILPPIGLALLIEIKSGRAHRSPAQAAVRRRFEAAGALCLLVRDVALFSGALKASLERAAWLARSITKGVGA